MSTGFDNEINAVLSEALTAFPARVLWRGVAYAATRSAVDYAEALEEGGLQEAVDFNLHLRRSDFPRNEIPRINETIEVDGREYRIVRSNQDEDDPELRLALSADLAGT